MYLVGQGRRTSPVHGDAELTPALRRVLRRLDAGRRAMLLATLDAGAERLGSRATLIVVTPETQPSPQMASSAPQLAAACAAGTAAGFRGDPALVLEVMDNLALAALSIGLGFTGDGLGFGPGSGQMLEALLTAWERLDDGASEVLLAAGETTPPLGVATRWSREPTPESRCRITRMERASPSGAAPWHAWLEPITELQRGVHQIELCDGAVSLRIEVEVP